MPAPGQGSHRQARCVGKLDKKNPIGGDLFQVRQIVVNRQGVEAVQDQSQMWMGGRLNDTPSPSERFDVSAPGQRFIADAKAVRGGPLCKLIKLAGNQLIIINGIGGYIGTDE